MYAWALPNVAVECMDDSPLVYFKNMEYQIKVDSTIVNTLNMISDIVVVISLIIFVLFEGRREFSYRVLAIVVFKYIMDIVFYQKNIYYDDQSVFIFSIVNNMSKKDSSLFNLGVSLLLECIREHFGSKKIIYKIVLSFHIVAFIVYFWVIGKFMTFQILFSFVIYDYLNKIG
jgi:hypothetical protein